jgi:hypothetical protein
MQKALDGDITERETAELHAHIEECSKCYDAWQDFMAVKNLLRSDDPVAPPPDFTSRLASRLEETPRVSFLEGYVVPFFLQNRIRLAMASFVLIIAGFGLLFNVYQRDNTFGGRFNETGGYPEAIIGIKSPGEPTFLIPTSDDPGVIKEHDAAIEETEKAVEYHETEILVND